MPVSGRAATAWPIAIAAIAYGALAVGSAVAIQSRAATPPIWQMFDQPAYRAMADHPFAAGPDTTRPPWCWRVLPSLVVHATHLGTDRGFHVLTFASFAVFPTVMMLLLRSMGRSLSTTLLIGGCAAMLPPINGNLAWAYAMTDAFVVVLIACAAWATVTNRTIALAICLVLLALSRETWMLSAVFAVIWSTTFNRRALPVVGAGVLAAALVHVGLRIVIRPSESYSLLGAFENLYLPLSTRNVLRRLLLSTGATWNVLTPVLAMALARPRFRREALAIGAAVMVSMTQPLFATETMRPVAAAAPFVYIACAMELDRWPAKLRLVVGSVLVAAQVPWLLKYGYVADPPLRGIEIAAVLLSVAAVPLVWRGDVFTKLRHNRAVGVLRYHLYRDVLLAFPRRCTCNICGWRGRRFLTYLDPFVLCPQCGSHVRQRLIAAALQQPQTIGVPVSWDRVLHISPEYSLGLTLRPRARMCVRADWATSDCDVRQDITAMPFTDAAFDAVVVCDTLEHIVDDQAAIRECRRILRPGGVAILTVPQNERSHETYEDPTLVSKTDRSRHFGQEDHVRNYGLDFGDRVAAAGFDVTCVDASAFEPALVKTSVLRPPTEISSPFGWTNRRVYFARRH